MLMRTLAIFSLALLSGCSTMEVGADWDTGAPFGTYKTYGWVEAPGKTIAPALRSDLLQRRVKAAVDRGLTAKGLTLAEKDPDLLVDYHAAVKKQLDLTTYRDYPTRGGWTGGTAYAESYDEGTLILDLNDRATKNLVWRGVARDEVNMVASPEEREAKLKEAVERMLEKFPPPAKK